MSEDGPAASPAAALPAVAFRVQFEGGPAFSVSPDQPILYGAAGAGIQIPSSCRNGSCRTCMCLLLSGQVTYRIQWPGLLPEELAQGWILLCIAYARSDLVLRWPRGVLRATQAAA